jgi:hypothetical protein
VEEKTFSAKRNDCLCKAVNESQPSAEFCDTFTGKTPAARMADQEQLKADGHEVYSDEDEEDE